MGTIYMNIACRMFYWATSEQVKSSVANENSSRAMDSSETMVVVVLLLVAAATREWQVTLVQ